MSDVPFDPNDLVSMPDAWNDAESEQEFEMDFGVGEGSDERWPEADWRELADYLTHAQSPQNTVATAQRLQTDAAFARLAAPILRFWETPLPGTDVDLDAAWAAIERRAAAQRLIPTVAPEVPSHPATTTAAVSPTRIPPAAPRRRVSWHWPVVSLPPVSAVAALLLLMVGSLASYIARRPREHAFRYYAASTALRSAGRTLLLPDGSRVTLAPGATLVTDNLTAHGGSGARRLVHLDGTGAFVVHADPTRPFIVEAYGIDAVAVGTTFDVAVHSTGAGNSVPTATVQVRVIKGKVVVQRQMANGHRETLAVLGPGEETAVQAAARYFKAGWAAGLAHKSIAEQYLEWRAMKVADSVRAALHAQHPSSTSPP